jgi:cytochrome c oxidase subunit 4
MAQTAHAGDNVERFGTGHAESGPEHHDQRDDHHHIVTPATYVKAIVVLMVLLIVTVLAAEVEMGILNVPIALLIATTKAIVIMMYFMHLKFSSKLVWIFAGVAFVFVGIMFALTMSDYFTRDWLANPGH